MSEDSKERALARFAAVEQELPGAGLPWLRALRREALDYFAARGFPTRRDEDWRFTDIAPLLRTPLEPARAARLRAAGSGRGVRAAPLDEALARHSEQVERWLGRLVDPKLHGFAALNTALFDTGLVVEIEPGAVLTDPIELELARPEEPAPGACHARVLVLAGAGSRAVVVERFGGAGVYWNNLVTEVVLERGAELDHVRVQNESGAAFHTAALAATLDAGARFGSHSIALGAALARADIAITLAAEGAQGLLHGLYLGRGSQLVDHHTLIDHAHPRTTSRELYKGILGGRSHGVFRGRVHVRPDAQKIDAAQTSRTLLLSDEATVNAKPQLEIYADDVRCSHGASIGKLDPDALFYLRTRGIGEAEARALLTLGFAREVLEALPAPALVAELEALVRDWLAAPGGDR